MNILKKLVGHQFDNRFAWGELYSNYTHYELGCSITTNNDEDRYLLILKIPLLFMLYLNLWKISDQQHIHSLYENSVGYGFYIYSWEDIVFEWNRKRYTYALPWHFQWHRTDYMDEDRIVHSDIHGTPRRYMPNRIKRLISETSLYRYNSKYDGVQRRYATYYVVRRIYRMHWFPFITKTYRTIDVSFNSGIGDGNSGVTGCSYELLPNESPEEGLRKMEATRKFN
jgi:hypothetical protein